LFLSFLGALGPLRALHVNAFEALHEAAAAGAPAAGAHLFDQLVAVMRLNLACMS
jgi:hypothetical protein